MVFAKPLNGSAQIKHFDIIVVMKYLESDGYTYALDINTSSDVTVYKFVSLVKQPYPCVKITVYDDSMVLDALNYYKSCSLSEKSLDKSQGTVHMLKVALAYVFDNHPNITHVDLQDETFIDIEGKPLITSRRLLQGHKGWYEEHLQAIPTGKTKQLLKFLRDPKRRSHIDVQLPKQPNTWWTASNIMKVCEMIRCPSTVFGTTWNIERSTVMRYHLTYRLKSRLNGGGSEQSNKRVARILKSAKAYPYELILQAKYR